MNYYKDISGSVHALSDEDIAHGGERYLPHGCVPITNAEVDAIRNPAPTLAQLKADRVAALSADCQAAIYAGFASDALGVAHHYPAKDKDQANLSGSVVASLLPGLPAGWVTLFWCMDAAGAWAFKPHTVAQIQQVGADGKAAIVAALMKNTGLVSQVEAATTPDEVNSIEW